MKKILCLFVSLSLGLCIYADTIIEAGSVEGTWTANASPYKIMGNIQVDDGEVLILEPGVEVVFQLYYTLFVNGCLLAGGTEGDSITFTAANPNVGWNSMRFLNTPLDNDTSRFDYCIFKYGRALGDFPDNCGGAIAAVAFGKIVIDHCLFTENQAVDTIGVSNTPGGGAIALDASSPIIRNSVFTENVSMAGGALICYNDSDPRIENCVFTENVALKGTGLGDGNGGAIICWILSDPLIMNNTFNGNHSGFAGGAIAMVEYCDPVIQGNLIYNNTTVSWGGGIEIVLACSPKIINNTISHNTCTYEISGGGGIDIWLESMVEIKNTILWANNAPGGGDQVWIDCDDIMVIDFYNCNIEHGIDSIWGTDCIGEYRDCIDKKPKFEDPDNGNYNLCWASWPVYDTSRCDCIDAGAGLWDPDGTACDIGALYFDQTPETPHAYEAINIHPSGFTALWDACAGASEYRLDVAYDINFTDFVENYHNLQVNDTSHDVNSVMADCYYRVRAANDAVTSDNSDTIPVIMTTLHENPLDGQFTIIAAAEGVNVQIHNAELRNSELSVFNLRGQKILTERLSPGSNYIPVNIGKQVLIFCIRSGNKMYSEKIMLRR